MFEVYHIPSGRTVPKGSFASLGAADKRCRRANDNLFRIMGTLCRAEYAVRNA